MNQRGMTGRAGGAFYGSHPGVVDTPTCKGVASARSETLRSLSEASRPFEFGKVLTVVPTSAPALANPALTTSRGNSICSVEADHTPFPARALLTCAADSRIVANPAIRTIAHLRATSVGGGA